MIHSFILLLSLFFFFVTFFHSVYHLYIGARCDLLFQLQTHLPKLCFVTLALEIYSPYFCSASLCLVLIWDSRGRLECWKKKRLPSPPQRSGPSSLSSFPLSLGIHQPSISIIRGLIVSCMSSSLGSKSKSFQPLPFGSCYLCSCYLHDAITFTFYTFNSLVQHT